MPLINSDDNLVNNSNWDRSGFIVDKLFKYESDYIQLQTIFKNLIAENLIECGYKISSDFHISQYHQLVKSDKEHYSFVKKMGNFFDASLLGDLKFKIEKRISEICGNEVTTKHPDYVDQVFNIRIVRPQSKDNNPLHRDIWLDRLRNGINIYVPIAGSNEKSSLPLIPESHYWSDEVIERTSTGAEVDGRVYTVPAIKKIKKPYELIRPNPLTNEVLVFSPYLIHGGASNLNEDLTRVSLEMRFWRK